MEAVVLALDAGVFDHGARVGLQAGHGAADVGVDFDNLFDGRGLEEGGGDALFDAEEDAMGGGDLLESGLLGGFGVGRRKHLAYADGCGAEFDCFEGVFDLEETAFWGEGAGEMVRIWLSGEGIPGKWSYLMPRSI